MRGPNAAGGSGAKDSGEWRWSIGNSLKNFGREGREKEGRSYKVFVRFYFEYENVILLKD